MKPVIILFIYCFPVLALSQQMQLQFHYDLRHTIDPKHTKKNFPAFYAEYFKAPGPDSIYGFIKRGSFLLKIQSEFSGERNNTGQFYMQISQAFRFWRPKVYMQLQYNGGLGIAEPGSYGYYLTNAFSLGALTIFKTRKTRHSLMFILVSNTPHLKNRVMISSAHFFGCNFFQTTKIGLPGMS